MLTVQNPENRAKTVPMLRSAVPLMACFALLGWVVLVFVKCLELTEMLNILDIVFYSLTPCA